MNKHYYMVINEQGNPLLMDARLPIFWYRRVAVQASKNYNGKVSVVKVTLNPIV